MSRAFKFGVKLALDMSDPRLLGGGAGAALGAGVGGLAGLVNPGVDENGKRKSRLGAALRGALGGGAVGGLGGAAAGHVAGPQMLDAKNKIMELLSKSMSPASAPSRPEMPAEQRQQMLYPQAPAMTAEPR